MSIKDSVIELIIRGRDYFTPDAETVQQAIEATKAKTGDLTAAMADLKTAQQQAARGSELEQYTTTLASNLAEARAALADMTAQMAATPGASSELKQALADSARQLNSLENQVASTTVQLDEQIRVLSASGTNLQDTAGEQKKLRTEAAALRQELKNLTAAQTDAAKLDSLRTNTESARREYERTQSSLKALAAQMDATKKPTVELKDAHALAKSEANRAATAYQGLSRTLEQHEARVAKAGIDAKNLGAAEQELASKIAGAQLRLAELSQTQAALANYDKLTPRLEKQKTALAEQQATLAKLRGEYSAAEAPQKAFAEQVRQAAQLAGRAQTAYEANAAKLEALRGSLKSAGVDTKDMAAAQQQLAATQQQTAAAVASQKERLGQLNKIMQAADVLARNNAAGQQTLAGKHGDANQVISAQAIRLQALRQRLDEASAGAKNMGNSIGGLVTRLTAMAGAYVGLDKLRQGLVGIVNTGGDFEVLREQLIGVYGDVASGERAFQWALDLNKRLPTSLQDVLDAFIMLKNNGMDPLDGTLEKMINANVRYGRGAETLIPIIRQLTQSWGKNKIQAEEAYVLIENGLPVWKLLEEATGRTTAELQKMSEQGKLTREYMVQLIDTMGKAGAGVVERRMTTWNTLLTKFTDSWHQAQDMIAKSGTLDYLKDQLGAVNAELQAMLADGRLAQYGREFADWVKAAVTGGKELLQTLYDWRGGIETLVKVWLTYKALNLIKDMNDLASVIKSKVVLAILSASTAMDTLGKKSITAKAQLVAMSTAGAGIKGVFAGAVGAVLQLVAGLGPLGLVAAGGMAVKSLYDISEAVWHLTVEEQRRLALAEQQRANNRQILEDSAAIMAANAEYADLVLLTAEQVAALSEADRKAYAERLVGAQAYNQAQQKQNKVLAEANILTEEQRIATEDYASKIKLAMSAMADGTADAMDRADKTLDNYINDVERAADAATSAADGSLGKVFADMGLDLEQLSGHVGKTVQEFVDGLQTMAQSSLQNGTAIREYLSKAFSKVTNQAELDALIEKLNLLRDQGKLSGEELANAYGQAAEAAGKLAKKNGDGAAQQIALLKEQKKAIEEAHAAGDLMGTEYTDQLGKVNQELQKLEKQQKKNVAATNQLTDAADHMGFKTTEQLEKAADDMRKYEQQVRTTGGTIHDQKEAFLQYAAAEIAAAEASGRVADGSLAARAAALGLTDQYNALKEQLKKSGDAGLRLLEILNEIDGGGGGLQQQTEETEQLTQAEQDLKDAHEGAASASAFLINQSTTLRTKLGDLSTAAQGLMDDIMGWSNANSSASSELDLLNQRLDENAKRLRTVSLAVTLDDIQWHMKEVSEAYLTAERAYLNQAVAAEKMQTRLEGTSQVTQSMINRAVALAGQMRLLDDEDLSGLRSAIDSAKQKLAAMQDEAKSAADTLADLQNQWDELNGNDAAVAQREQLQKLAELQEKLTEARAAGNREAIKSYEQAIALQEKLYAAKEKQRLADDAAAKAQEAAEKKAADEAARQAKNQAAQEQFAATQAQADANLAARETTHTLEIKFPNGTSTQVKGVTASQQSEIETALKQLTDAMSATA